MIDIVGSLVVYNPKMSEVSRVIESFFSGKDGLDKKLVIVDNSSKTNELDFKKYLEKVNVEYIYIGENIGFGAGHNVVVRKYVEKSQCFVVLNPDVYFGERVLINLFGLIKANEGIGLASGSILNDDGSEQRVHRRLPSIFDLFLRRFAPSFVKRLFKHVMDYNILSDIEISKPYTTPYISGCFMFFRSSILKHLNGFDESFFMYMEDVDISRRAFCVMRNIVYPDVKIYHSWRRASYKSKKFLLINLKSNLTYYCKWGIWFDKERIHMNRKTQNVVVNL